ncbi:WNT8 [Lepeophtheirus salmonis]|uniref:Protein Wnt n=1 Tax=Lepeophtheirus salmonis TaxID=72036 RepID=A0A7R8H6T7_LEPSM|nr:WNT8 [Lepeophtheirus salmonis]CAF2909884.1 WNT8 [Lepeophtheirus salmonis]
MKTMNDINTSGNKISMLTELASTGAIIGVKECEHQFRFETWNCPRNSFASSMSSNVERRSRKKLGPLAVWKIVAVIPSTQSQSKAGNGAAVVIIFSFGEKISKLFLDNTEPGTSLKSLTNLHNIKAGRIAVQRTMKRLCKCHGVSGSCTAQTCWKQLSEFRSVGDHLKKMYKKATRIHADHELVDDSSNQLSNRVGSSDSTSDQISNSGLGSVSMILVSGGRNRRRRVTEKKNGIVPGLNAKKVKNKELVYLQDSPDYCRRNPITGANGVLGRTCSTEPDKPESRIKVRDCKKMCLHCGYKIQRSVVEVYTSCKCRFQWCCNVTCQTCKKKKIKITCCIKYP